MHGPSPTSDHGPSPTSDHGPSPTSDHEPNTSDSGPSPTSQANSRSAIFLGGPSPTQKVGPSPWSDSDGHYQTHRPRTESVVRVRVFGPTLYQTAPQALLSFTIGGLQSLSCYLNCCYSSLVGMSHIHHTKNNTTSSAI